MNFSYRARLALIALLLVLSTLFASCDILVTVVPSTGTQETTLEETTPETTTPDASSPDETTLEESTPEEVETPEETSAQITTPEETTESTPEATTESTPKESTESSPEESTESTPEETTPAEPEVNEPAADSVLTIEQAIALGSSKEHDTWTEGKYYVTGVITEVYNTLYNNLKITDGEGNILTIYGTYSTDGSTRYDQLAVKPVAGDTVTIYGIVGQFNGTPQIKNGWIVSPETTPAEPEVQDPAADSTLTIEQAIALGSSKEHNTFTENKYYITGVVKEIKHTTYGNMYLVDENGNSIYVYGTYSADGEIRYDSLTTKPVAGDTVTLYAVVGNYNGAQIKSGWIVKHTAVEPEVTTPEVTTPETTTPNIPEETAPEAGTVKVVIADYAKNNNWTNSTTYPSIPLNSYITASAQGNAVGSYNLNTGKYYTTGQNWRLYQTEKATLTISGEGKSIVSVKVSYASEKTGVLTFNGKNIASDTVVAVNANSITFGVGNTDATVTNGQVRVTAIEVVYGGSAEIPEETTPTEPEVTTPEPDVTIPEPEGTTSVPEVEEIPKEFEELNIPAYSGSKFVAINNNVPFFTKEEYTTNSYESYSPLDALGRCGVAMACVGRDIMPTDSRGDISDVKPTGWVQAYYDVVNGGYLYNRSHLIGWQLTGENDNEKNLITGTRSFNQLGMLPFENMVADYIKETNNHVLYRVTPVFVGNELVARGVLMEAWSVEDNGEGVCFNVFVYNVQPGVIIDYATGVSRLENETPSNPNETPECNYIANENSKKFHEPDCRHVADMSEKNKGYYTATREEMIAMGYTPCGTCAP